MSTKRRTLPIVLSHYDIPGDADGSFRAKCKHCRSTISGSTKATYLKFLDSSQSMVTTICIKYRIILSNRIKQHWTQWSVAIQRSMPQFIINKSKLLMHCFPPLLVTYYHYPLLKVLIFMILWKLQIRSTKFQFEKHLALNCRHVGTGPVGPVLARPLIWL